MDIQLFSNKYQVKKITTKDLDDIQIFCLGNPMYYEYCPPMVTKESIRNEMKALPPNITLDRKYYVGFYDSSSLIAILDLINGYPKENIAFIGFFMTDTKIQRKGIGSQIIEELSNYLRFLNFSAIRLAWVNGNRQAECFWLKNKFKPLKEISSLSGENVILAERTL